MAAPTGEPDLAPRPTEFVTLTTHLVGRVSGALWIACGALVVVAGGLIALPVGAQRVGVVSIGLAAVSFGLVIWNIRWERWHRSATLYLVPLALAMIALHDTFTGNDGFLYSAFYLVVFVWLGLAHPPGMSLRFAPLFVLAYVLPLVLAGDSGRSLGLASATYVVPCCILVGETVAWVGNRLRTSEQALVDAEARFRSAFEQAPIGIGLATSDGRILRANRAFGEILGRSPEEVAGSALRDLTHPDDWEANAAQIRALFAGETDQYQMEKRYIHADGHVVWVSVSTSIVRDSAGEPVYMIGQIEDITERREMRERLAHAAVHDQLTGLPNRVLFMDRLELSLRRCQRSDDAIALMFLDLDRFKLINDSLGHEIGDRLLQRVAQRLRTALRAGDTLARFGGDEFTVLCDVHDRSEALEVAERLVAAMQQPLSVSGNEIFVSASIGVALSTDGGESGADMLRNADVAMYRAKTLGAARVAVYREDDQGGTIGRLRTSNELHRALERDELELYYQPVIELRTQALVGMEALVRWRHPSRGLLLPAEFIPLAEDSGLIMHLGAWVLRDACRQVAEWSARRTLAGEDDTCPDLSINVSAQQIAEADFPAQVAATLEETGLDPDRLRLEITESTLMGNTDATMQTLRALRDLGLHLEIDDFGTGYSSLSYLKQFPVETLKVDRSFVDELDHDSGDVAIVRAIIALGESLGLSVIAEGVEREAQAHELLRLGCRLAQGYLFGVPLPASALGPFPTEDLAAWQPGRVRSSA
ncbi:MAG TPA: EAL domain-containing protein [Acidimicrobiales bacterium]|nr:EAL domain-containing protein [Acidimicrobiales bacterium]